MTQSNGMSQGMQTENYSIENLHQIGLNIALTLSEIVCSPLEMILRPQYGTRYFSPIISLGSSVMWLLLPAIAAIPDIVRSMIPFTHMHNEGPVAILGLGGMAEIYFLGSFAHGIRLWRRMIHPETEQHSEFSGPSIVPFFKLLPHGKRHHFVRIVYEPALCVVSAIALSDFNILTLGAARYVFFAGIAMAVRGSIDWYRGWLYVRILLDAKFAAPIVAAMAEGKATEEQLASIHMATFPKNLPPEIRTAAIAHVTATLSPETARLVSPVEPPAKPPVRTSPLVQPIAGLLLCAALSLLQVRAQAPPTPNAYVANGADNTVSVVSVSTDKVIATIPVGQNPVNEVISPDGSKVYVANHGNGNAYGSGGTSNVSVIDTAANKVIATIGLNNPQGSAVALAIAPDGTKLYVSSLSIDAIGTAGKTISVISAATNAITGSIDVAEGIFPYVMAVSPDGKELYCASHDGDTIMIISTAAERVTAMVELRNQVLVNNTGVSGSPEAIVFSNDGKRAYIACMFGETFAEIDTQTHKVTFPATFRPRVPLSGLAMTPTGILYAIAGENGLAFAIDTQTDTILKSGGLSNDGRMLFVGAKPSSIAITQDAKRAYVANRGSNDLSIIDVAKNQVVGSVPVGRMPTAVVIQPSGATAIQSAVARAIADLQQKPGVPVAPGPITTTVPVQPKASTAIGSPIVVQPPQLPATPIKLKGPLGMEVDIPLPRWHRKPKTNQ